MRCNWIYICISDYGQSQEYHQVVDKIGKNETINGNTDYMKNIGIQCVLSLFIYLSRLVGKPTMWFPNRSYTNRAVQSQKRARSLKFRI